MSCYSKLNELYEKLNSTIGFSFDVQNNLKETNELYSLFKEYNVIELLYNDICEFINIMNSNDYNIYSSLRKIHLHESDLVKVYSQYSYLFGLFFDNKECYRNFSVFFKECVDYFKIDKYFNLPLDEVRKILNRYVDISMEYNISKNRFYDLLMNKSTLNTDKYNNYLNSLSSKKTVNPNDSDEFFVYSENDAYLKECNTALKFSDIDPNRFVNWVSRYHGDGYGYDILSYDFLNNKEKLIEVKSGLYEIIYLSRVEYKTMLDTQNKPNSDYYIYRYYYDLSYLKIRFNCLKYDKINNVFVDVNTNEIFIISPQFLYDETGRKIVAGIYSMEQYNKLLTR